MWRWPGEIGRFSRQIWTWHFSLQELTGSPEIPVPSIDGRRILRYQIHLQKTMYQEILRFEEKHFRVNLFFLISF